MKYSIRSLKIMKVRKSRDNMKCLWVFFFIFQVKALCSSDSLTQYTPISTFLNHGEEMAGFFVDCSADGSLKVRYASESKPLLYFSFKVIIRPYGRQRRQIVPFHRLLRYESQLSQFRERSNSKCECYSQCSQR